MGKIGALHFNSSLKGRLESLWKKENIFTVLCKMESILISVQ